MGSGQLRPFTSSSRSAVVTVVTYILRAVAYFNIGLRQVRIKVYHSRTGATAAPGALRGQDGVTSKFCVLLIERIAHGHRRTRLPRFPPSSADLLGPFAARARRSP